MSRSVATAHSCSGQHSPRCPTHQAGRPKTKACPVCNAAWATHQGVYAVVTWRGDGRYSVDEAHATYVREAAAERRAAEDPTLVVRFLPA